jgi:DNA-binding protein HU-beta
MDPLTKREIAELITMTHQLPVSKAQKILNTVLDSIGQAVESDRPVRLHKFGTFYSFMSKEREGVNPRTKAKIQIPSKKRIRFKASESFGNLDGKSDE